MQHVKLPGPSNTVKNGSKQPIY